MYQDEKKCHTEEKFGKEKQIDQFPLSSLPAKDQFIIKWT